MRLGVGSVFGFLRKSTTWRQHALCGAIAPVFTIHKSLVTADPKKYIGNIAGSRFTHRPGALGANPRPRFSTGRDGNKDKKDKEPGKPQKDTNESGSKHNSNATSDQKPDFPDGTPSPQRIELYRGIRAQNPERVWDAFNDVANSSEWDQLTEEEIAQVIHIFNNQFSFERSKQALDRVKSIFYICTQRQFVFQKTWSYNEMIRLNIAEGRRELAYKLKSSMESGEYGPGVVVNIHTYASFFNDPYISSRKEIAQLIDLYDEMTRRNIKPDTRIQKALILFARKSGETQLLTTLLDSTSTDDIPHNFSSLAARVISARTKAFISINKPGLAHDELMKLVSYQIPKDTRHIPPEHVSSSDSGQVQIPLAYSRTRDAFFVYLRSAYEALIQLRLRRRNPHVARDLLEDMRRISYLPPTLAIYEQFVRYHAKRKGIRQLREIYEMMQQDGVKVTEHFYTKIITACMFTPKQRLLDHLKSKAVKISQDAQKEKSTYQYLGAATLLDIDGSEIGPGLNPKEPAAPDGMELSEIALDERAEEELDRLIFYPNECILFFDDMLADYGVSPGAIHDKGYIPNINITNSVMRAYIRLERYALALREFVRYCYHQKQLYPMSRPLDVERNPRTIAFVFRMALGAAQMRKDAKHAQKIYTTMREWGVKIPERDMYRYKFM